MARRKAEAAKNQKSARVFTIMNCPTCGCAAFTGDGPCQVAYNSSGLIAPCFTCGCRKIHEEEISIMPKKSKGVEATQCPLCKEMVKDADIPKHLKTHSLARAEATTIFGPPSAQVSAAQYQGTTTPQQLQSTTIAPPQQLPTNPFLKLQHIWERGGSIKAKIVGVRNGGGSFGPSYNVDVVDEKGAALTLGVRVNSRKHHALYKKFGASWIGQTIVIRPGNPATEGREQIGVD